MMRLSIAAWAIACTMAFVSAAHGQVPVLSTNPNCDEIDGPSFDFLVRADFNDLGPAVCASRDPFQAIGATVSAANNVLTGQYSAALDGLAAATMKHYGSASDLVGGWSAGLFVQANDTYQFQSATLPAGNTDSVTSGAFAQLMLNNEWGYGGYTTLRLRGGEVTGSSGTTSTSMVGEIIPVYNLGKPLVFGIRTSIGDSPIDYALLPELMVQYDQYNNGPNKFLIFSSHTEALRVGPQVGLQLYFAKQPLLSYFNESVAAFLSNTFATITYHASFDTYSSKQYVWTLISLTHTINTNFGITASYGSGNSEATGNLTRQAKLGLAVKF